MNYKFPHTIENWFGEKIIFKSVDPVTDRIDIESFCQPGVGPVMHTHFKQDECITVISGRIGYQVMGEEKKFAGPGETVLFERGVTHKFWAEGEVVLHCKGWVQPANTFIFFLSAVFAAQNKSRSHRPETFDGAYLLTRYASEYDLAEIPGFVKKLVLPLQVSVGKLLGKYQHFKVKVFDCNWFTIDEQFYESKKSPAGDNMIYRKEYGWNGSLRYRFMDDRPANEDYSVVAKGYFIVDAAINYTKKKWEAGLSVQNLLNSKWKETQFNTESRLKNEPAPVSEIHFTPGTPFFARASFTLLF